jgi:hypothetical protein
MRSPGLFFAAGVSLAVIYRLDDALRNSAGRLNAAILLAGGLAGLSLPLGLVGVYGS